MDTQARFMELIVESAERIKSARSTEEAVTNAVHVYVTAALEIKRLEAVQKKAKDALAEIMVETGREKWETPAGAVQVSRSSVRTTWDTKALDTLIGDDPALASRLLPHRHETHVAGSMTIRAPGKQKEKEDG